MSALQQGAGVRDGVAEEEGSVELGPKRLWKVSRRELHSRRPVLPQDGSWEPYLPSFSGVTELNLELSPVLPFLFPSFTYPLFRFLF